MAVFAALRAMPRFVMERIKIGGEWVSRLVAMPADTIAEAPAIEDASVARADDLTGLRRVAAALAQGRDPGVDELLGVPEKHVSWLKSMTRRELCVLLTSHDADIRAHMRGIRPLKGLVPYDQAAIIDLTAARAKRPSTGRRTLREVLAEREAAEKEAALAAM